MRFSLFFFCSRQIAKSSARASATDILNERYGGWTILPSQAEQTLMDRPLHKLGIFMPPSRQPMKKHIPERRTVTIASTRMQIIDCTSTALQRNAVSSSVSQRGFLASGSKCHCSIHRNFAINRCISQIFTQITSVGVFSRKCEIAHKKYTPLKLDACVPRRRTINSKTTRVAIVCAKRDAFQKEKKTTPDAEICTEFSWRETNARTKRTVTAYHEHCSLSPCRVLRSLSTARNTDRQCRQTDKTAQVSRNLKWAAWVLRIGF